MNPLVQSRTFASPGTGAWELDQTHFSRPMTPLAQETIAEPFARGFSESTRHYGVLLDRMETGFVHGLVYMRACPVGAPAGPAKAPPKLLFKGLQIFHPEVRRRIAVSRVVFETKRWREDLKYWDEEVKPASIRAHRALQAIDLEQLGEEELADHLVACRDNFSRMIAQHHRFTITCSLPVGDYLSHARDWTGLSYGELLGALRGASPVSNGVASEELGELAQAVQVDPEAMALIASGEPAAEVLARLRAMEGRVGSAANRYIEAVSYRILGYDISDRCAIEMPEMLVKAIRVMADPSSRRNGNERLAEMTAAIREKVDPAHRDSFDELLGEARLINRLRDERGFYSDAWATGLMRRAVLEAGRRATRAGHLDDPELLIDATMSEMLSFVRGEPTVAAAELRERAHWRTNARAADAPRWLGSPPGPPPPPEWLPAPAARTARAMDVFMSALFKDAEEGADDGVVRGLSVSAGVYEGVARVIAGPEEFGRLEPGDVLVTRATSAYFNTVLPLLGALVTDRGGQLSHAAIVAREYGIPGVVGTRVATSRIPDGARVRVDGGTGEVKLL